MNNFKNFFQSICAEYKMVGANIIVSNEDEEIARDSYGHADIENNISINNDTVLRIASISKIIVALGIMKLVEEGKLSLNDDVNTIFDFPIRNPKYPNTPITIKMITTQTSSISDGYSDELDDIPTKGYNGVNGSGLNCTLKDLLYDTNSEYYTELTFSEYKPGTHFEYSNFGCGILACIIEKLTGKYYFDYLNEILFAPLHLDASFRVNKIKHFSNIGGIYSPTLRKRDGNHFLKYLSNPAPIGENYRGPAGGCFISNNDLTVIMRLLINKGTYKGIKLFKKETIEYMYQQAWFGYSDDSYRGKAIQMRIYDKLDRLILRGHTGGAYGVRSFMFFSMKYKIGVCFISNGSYNPQMYTKVEEFFYKIQKYVYDNFVTYENTKFTICKDSKVIKLKERDILLDNDIIVDNDDLLIPFVNIVDALELALKIESDSIVKINNKVINLIEINNTNYVSIKKLLDELNITYIIDNDNYIITKSN